MQPKVKATSPRRTLFLVAAAATRPVAIAAVSENYRGVYTGHVVLVGVADPKPGAESNREKRSKCDDDRA
jgi:hypothetical protein